MSLSPSELARILNQPGYSVGYASFDPHPSPSGLPHPLPKQDAVLPSLGENEDEKGSAGRIIVRIERRGTKLLDVDNLYGSAKWVCDALRYAKLIPEDDPEAIELIVTQKKVKRGETETVIQITKP